MRKTPTTKASPPEAPELPAAMRFSVLGSARARRRWTIEEAAARADLDPEVIEALEEASVYRFESTQDALAAAVVYATALGIERREARQLVGLPVRSRAVAAILSRRFLALLAFLGTLGGLVWLAVVPRMGESPVAPPAAAPVTHTVATTTVSRLPPYREIEVVVYNGSKRPTAGTELAKRVSDLGYYLAAVAEAPRHDYPRTRVYFVPGGEAIATRLARQLGVTTEALPGGEDPERLVVIVGASS